MGCRGGGHRTAVGLSSGRCKRCGCLDCHHASLLVRCHAPQYRHLYVLSCVGPDSLSVILSAAVEFAPGFTHSRAQYLVLRVRSRPVIARAYREGDKIFLVMRTFEDNMPVDSVRLECN